MYVYETSQLELQNQLVLVLCFVRHEVLKTFYANTKSIFFFFVNAIFWYFLKVYVNFAAHSQIVNYDLLFSNKTRSV